MNSILPAIVLALAFSISFHATGAAITNAAELTYEQVKQQFEKDETLGDVRISSFTASGVTVIYKGRYLNYDLSKLSPAQRGRIDQLIENEKEMRRAETMKENEEAARAGMLREVDGVTYNLLKPNAGWVPFNNVKVFQRTSEGVLVDVGRTRYDLTLIFVRNLPQYESVVDGDNISFSAKQVSAYTYLNRDRVEKTVRQYDCGTIPGKAKAPALVRAPERPGTKLDASWASSGTGFFISSDGYLATCNHVVKGGTLFSVRQGASKYNARVVATDDENDVALLKVEGAFKSLALNTNALRLGQSAFTIGFPNIDIQGFSPKYTAGQVSSLSGIHDEASAIQISVPVQPGNSGGPLADERGNIVGIVVARLSDYAALKRTRSLPQNVNYAVKMAPLVQLVRQAGIESRVRFSTARAGDPVKAVEEATALILVSE